MKNLFVFLLIILLAVSAFAADGDLDASFGAGGKVSTDVGASYDSAINAVQQTDGKIVTVGTTRNTDNDPDNLLLVRSNTNGSLDTTFGTSGKVIVVNTTSTSTNFGLACGIALQADGKILVTTANNRRGTVFRFNTDGSRDSTFGTNGLLSLPTNTSVYLTFLGDVAVLPGGKILIAGAGNANNFNQGFGLARLNQDGSFDTTFGTGGIVRTTFAADTSTTVASASKIVIGADSKIVLGGEVVASPVQSGIAVYNADGSPDTTFNANGKLLVPATYPFGFGSITRQSDGKIIIGGRRTDSSDNGFSYLRRYTASGTLDTTFGTNGEINVRVNNNMNPVAINDLTIQPDGKLLVFGSALAVLPNISRTSFTLLRYLTNGTPDAAFGTNGVVFTPFDTTSIAGSSQSLTGLLQTDGKIVAAGTENAFNSTTNTINANVALVRYSNSPGIVAINNPTLRIADFDGDLKSDVSVFRRTDGTWYVNPSGATQTFYGVNWGLATDIPAPADYDGDGKTDVAVWRGNPGDPNRSNFYILNSQTNTVRVEQFGREGDNPTISGDWDGDGKANLAVFRPGVNGGQSYFLYRPSSQAGVDFISIYWGKDGDTPIFGDFDGDRKLDATIYRPSESTYYVRRSSDGSWFAQQWGIAANDAIFAGDFDGDGKSDFAVYRFAGNDAGVWYVLQSSAVPAFRAIRWGLGSDLPVPADYDGDGKMDFAVFRRSDKVWYIQDNATGAFRYAYFGLGTDFPIQLNQIR